MKQVVIFLFCLILDICVAVPECECEHSCIGLEERDSYYGMSTTPPLTAKRMLKGTKKVLGVPAGESLTLTINATENSANFDVTKVCVWTKNVRSVMPTFNPPHGPSRVSVGPNGELGMTGSGTGVLGFDDRSRVTLDNPSNWKKNCFESLSGLKSQINLVFEPQNRNTKMMFKALHMLACPTGVPVPVCNTEQTLASGEDYFQFSGPRKILGGSQPRTAVRAGAGRAIRATISPKEGDIGFLIRSLCLHTMNADEINVEYAGIPRITRTNGGVSGVGGGLIQNRITIENPEEFSETCIGFQLAVFSRVSLTIRSSDSSAQVTARGLTMSACAPSS